MAGEDVQAAAARVRLRIEQIDAAGDRDAAFAAREAGAGHVQRRHRGRAVRVHGDARPLEVEVARDHADQGTLGLPGRRRHAEIDAGARAAQAARLAAAVAGGVEQAAHRVHEQRLLTRQADAAARASGGREFGLARRLAQEAAPLVVAAAGLDRVLAVLAVETVERPAMRRDLGDAVAAGHEVGPVFVQVVGVREVAAHRDHRDRLEIGCRPGEEDGAAGAATGDERDGS